MAYTVGEDCKKIYMVTSKDSAKYRNLQTNDLVSLLIDTRGNQQEKSAKAVTVTGRFKTIDDEETLSRVRKDLVSRHPLLAVFLSDALSCVFSIEIDSFLLLDGFTDAYFERIQ